MLTRQTTSLPDVQQFDVADGNWNTDRGPIHSIVLHTMVGTVTGANARFNIPNAQVSAHYGIGLDGKLYQWVDEDNVAFHAGDYLVNQTSIGLEHEDGTNPETNPNGYNSPRPDILYESSAKLVAEICRFYDFPADHDHIFRHENVIDKQAYPGGTACPDSLDTDRIIAMADAILNPPVDPTPPVPETPVAPVEPTVPVVEPTVPVQTPVVPQVDANPVQNTPAQTVTPPIEATSEVSGQAGKVPFIVASPESLPKQSKWIFPDWLIQLILKGLSFIGVEKKS